MTSFLCDNFLLSGQQGLVVSHVGVIGYSVEDTKLSTNKQHTLSR